MYDEESTLYGFVLYDNTLNTINKYFYIRDILGNIIGIIDINGNVIVKYDYSAYGDQSITGSSSQTIGVINPFRYKGYYYDSETGLYCCGCRYYSPELCRFISPDSIEYLDLYNINGLNLYAYANNNPVGIARGISSVGGTSITGGLVSSINAGNSFTGNVNSGSPSKGGLNLGWLTNGLDTGSTIHGLYTSTSGLVNHTAYFAKNLAPFADDMTMLGASMKDGVLAFNQFTWKFGKSDAISALFGVVLDVYDSIQRGVSTGGIVLGATLTVVEGVGLIYLNKGIIYCTTAIGSAICPGPGTVVGYAVGSVACVFVDIFVSKWIDDLIDSIAK